VRWVALVGTVLLVSASCGRFAFDRAGDAGADGHADAPSDAGLRPFGRRVYVKASNAGGEDRFGLAVAISRDGSTVAVGAPLESSAATTINGDENNDGAPESGAVYVFRRVGDTWTQEAYIKAANADSFDQFGWSVALSADGNTLVAGARREDSGGAPSDNSVANSGAAYVFVRDGTLWSQQAYLKASNPDVQDAFGEQVAISGDGSTIAAASFFEDSAARTIDGNAADNSASAAGAVYVFVRAGMTWSQQAYVKASNAEANDELGRSLALSHDGNTLVAGAIREDSGSAGVNGDQDDNSMSNAGAAYVFTRAGTTWTQRAYLKASNPGSGDVFGLQAAFSADATVLAIGAIGEASAARGIDGAQGDNSANSAGAVYVFSGGGASWTQKAYIKASNTDAGDELGYAVSLSAAGDRLVASALYEASSATGIDGAQDDNSMPGAGAVYSYVDRGGWSQDHYLKADYAGVDHNFGWRAAVAGDGNTLVVGAPFDSSGAQGIGQDGSSQTVPRSGAVYIYY
jgi:trimeric autotransporter adhesin